MSQFPAPDLLKSSLQDGMNVNLAPSGPTPSAQHIHLSGHCLFVLWAGLSQTWTLICKTRAGSSDRHGFCLLLFPFHSPCYLYISQPCASQVVLMVKNSPAMQESRVQSLGREDPLEKGMATHSGILAWRIPMDRGAWWAAVHGVTKSRTGLSD